MNGVKALDKALEPIKSEYSYIVIDNQPLVGTMQMLQAANCADDMIITLHPDSANVQGCVNLIEGLPEIRQLNPKLRIDGILLGRNRATNNERLYISLMMAWAAKLETRVYRTIVREGVCVQEAQGNAVWLWDDYADEGAARDFSDFVDKYLRKDQHD
ncbi:MAG: ParA family protein [Clostridiales bacterium]|jgi:chromosome partitioning protein|nr:ParA family protein [Clostridiales bacterium]